MSVLINGTKGLTFADNSTQNTAASGFGFKNRIINGDMRIDQRNAGASVTPLFGANYYPVDRFVADVSQSSKFTAQRNAGAVTLPAGFVNYLGVTSSSAYSVTSTDFFRVAQRIEGLNVSDLAWGTASAATVTLSFWARSSLTGTFGGCIQNASVDRSYPFSYSISSANTWTYITVTIPGDTTGTWLTTNGTGVFVQWGLGVGSTYSAAAGAWTSGNYVSATGATSVVGTAGATFYITGVQLEKGSTATSFDYRDYGRELMMCQRYYEKSYNAAATPGTVGGSGGYNGIFAFSKPVAAVSGEGNVRFAVSKRSPPTVTVFNPDSGASGSYRDFSGNANRTGITLFDQGEAGFKFVISDALIINGAFQFVAVAEL